jgi:hypothetical protein
MRRQLKRLLIDSDQQLQNIKNVQTDIVHFNKMWDIHPFKGPVIDARTAVFDDCDKNFVFYWTLPRVLPTAKTVYLLSHPCEPDVFWTLDKMGATVFLHEFWSNYAARWAPERMLKERKLVIMKREEVNHFRTELNSIEIEKHD